MAAKLKPWAVGPYELIRHAEGHRTSDGDFDRRMALISYDNAIEQCVQTFLRLDPKQRGGQSFEKDQVATWLKNFYSKLDFLKFYLERYAKRAPVVSFDEMIFYHSVRNDLYHGGNGQVPALDQIDGIREAALWTFEILFGMDARPFLDAEDAGTPVEIKRAKELPPQSQVLAEFAKLRRDLDEMRTVVARTIPSASSKPSDREILERFVPLGNDREKTDHLHALSEVAQLSETVAEGKGIVATASDLKRLQSLLADLRRKVAVSLRAHHSQLAEAASRATLEAVAKHQHVIGAVHQVTGSGISSTMAVYVSVLSAHDAFRNYPILIVSDRTVILEQAQNRLNDFFENIPSRNIERPYSAAQLHDTILAPESVIILTTQQRLASATSDGAIDRPIIVVGLDVSLDSEVFARLSGAFRIWFTSSLPRRGIPVIAAYDVGQAVADGAIVPVLFESRELFLRHELQQPDVSALNNRGAKWLTPAVVSALAKDIYYHFNKQRNAYPARALVIAPDIAAADEIGQKLKELGAANDCSETEVVTSRVSRQDVDKLLIKVNDPSSNLRFVVCADMWVGLDSPLFSDVYVARKMSLNVFHQLAGRLGRPWPGKSGTRIVDYSGNVPPLS